MQRADQNSQNDRIEHTVPDVTEPVGHYSTSVSYGGLLYISGVVGMDKDGAIVGRDDITKQAEQVYKNIKTILNHAGLGYEDLLKITTYLTSISERSKVDLVRRAAFGSTKPASTLIGINELADPDLKIEVEAVAALRSGKSTRADPATISGRRHG